LASLSGLECLWLYDNEVEDISPLTQLINLIELDLGANRISDISILALCSHLELLCLDDNPLNTPAYCSYLPLIEIMNPLTTDYVYDENPNPLTSDCSTNMAELAQWAGSWLDGPCDASNEWCSGGDLDHLGDVESGDFAQFGKLWLAN